MSMSQALQPDLSLQQSCKIKPQTISVKIKIKGWMEEFPYRFLVFYKGLQR